MRLTEFTKLSDFNHLTKVCNVNTTGSGLLGGVLQGDAGEARLGRGQHQRADPLGVVGDAGLGQVVGRGPVAEPPVEVAEPARVAEPAAPEPAAEEPAAREEPRRAARRSSRREARRSARKVIRTLDV